MDFPKVRAKAPAHRKRAVLKARVCKRCRGSRSAHNSRRFNSHAKTNGAFPQPGNWRWKCAAIFHCRQRETRCRPVESVIISASHWPQSWSNEQEEDWLVELIKRPAPRAGSAVGIRSTSHFTGRQVKRLWNEPDRKSVV